MLIDAISPGLRVGGQHFSLPIKVLPQINAAMRFPVHHDLGRPLLTSYPAILGLFVLLRCSEIVITANKPKRLVIDPEMVDRWRALSPIDQYMHLLVTWFCDASLEVVGNRTSMFNRIRDTALSLYCKLEQRVTELDADSFFNNGMENSSALGLLQEFGWIKLQYREPAEGKAATLERVERTEFGDSMFVACLGGERTHFVRDRNELIGELQKVFPEWTVRLETIKDEAREGRHIFKVSIGKVWRRIAAPSDANLDDLAAAILDTFEFTDNHLYEFLLKLRSGKTKTIVGPRVDGEFFTEETLLGELEMEVGESMIFHFDFGDDWQFDVLLEKFDESNTNADIELLQSHGDPPPQYDNEDWDDDFDEEG